MAFQVGNLRKESRATVCAHCYPDYILWVWVVMAFKRSALLVLDLPQQCVLSREGSENFIRSFVKHTSWTVWMHLVCQLALLLYTGHSTFQACEEISMYALYRNMKCWVPSFSPLHVYNQKNKVLSRSWGKAKWTMIFITPLLSSICF